MPRNVAVVFTTDYCEALERLAFHTPVWVVDTPQNRAAAENAWRSAVEWPHISVTLFRAPDEQPTRDDWRALLEQIAFQERAVDTVDVVGMPLGAVARAALTDAGFERFDHTREGFRARRA
jgi:hypothetical protein